MGNDRFLVLFLHVLVSPFKTRARLEAEIVLLRHQLNTLRQRVPSEPRLTVADRAFDCISAGSRALGVGGQEFRWRSAG